MGARSGRARSARRLVVLRTVASVPLVTSEKRVLKLARSVSPRARVPERKATPMNTAKKVPASRRFRAHRPWRVSLPMSSAPEGLDAVEHAFGRGLVHAIDEAPVGEEQDGVGVAGGHRVVGH